MVIKLGLKTPEKTENIMLDTRFPDHNAPASSSLHPMEKNIQSMMLLESLARHFSLSEEDEIDYCPVGSNQYFTTELVGLVLI